LGGVGRSILLSTTIGAALRRALSAKRSESAGAGLRWRHEEKNPSTMRSARSTSPEVAVARRIHNIDFDVVKEKRCSLQE